MKNVGVEGDGVWNVFEWKVKKMKCNLMEASSRASICAIRSSSLALWRTRFVVFVLEVRVNI